ncbi:MAG: RHS repeat-associated core domain-containing protein, partial [Planctomycetota bacterium]
YDAYGNPYVLEPNFADDPDGKTDWANPYYFTGRRADFLDGGNLTLQINRHRYYDYYTGRWLTHDPRGITPGRGAANPLNIYEQYRDGLNLYEYVMSRTVVMVDPSGLACDCVQYYMLHMKTCFKTRIGAYVWDENLPGSMFSVITTAYSIVTTVVGAYGSPMGLYTTVGVGNFLAGTPVWTEVYRFNHFRCNPNTCRWDWASGPPTWRSHRRVGQTCTVYSTVDYPGWVPVFEGTGEWDLAIRGLVGHAISNIPADGHAGLCTRRSYMQNTDPTWKWPLVE